MHDINRASLPRKIKTSFTSRKVDMINAVGFDHERIDPFTFRVFHALLSCLNEDNGLCCPSDDYIVMLAGGCSRSVKRSRNKLRYCDYIDWRTRCGLDGKKHNFYTFHHPSAVITLASVDRKRKERQERREMLRREIREASSHKSF